MLPTLYAAKINEIILPPRLIIATHAQIDVNRKMDSIYLMGNDGLTSRSRKGQLRNMDQKL